MKHTKFPALLMAVTILMSILTVPASANTGGVIHGGPSDATDIMPSVDWLFRDQVQFMGECGANVRADYDAMTFEFLDKNDQPLGYKVVMNPDSRDFIYYGPDGKVLPAIKDIDWSADNPFATAKYATPVEPVTPSESRTAKENLQRVKVDGKDVTFAMYSPDNGGTNYVRLVDLAVAMKGTAGQFNVGYDGKVLLTAGAAYEGAASTAPFHGEMEYTMLDEPTYVNGVAQDLEAIRFEYQNGGYTYYKLRDLGEALGFNVGWDKVGEFIYIESDKPYDPTN